MAFLEVLLRPRATLVFIFIVFLLLVLEATHSSRSCLDTRRVAAESVKLRLPLRRNLQTVHRQRGAIPTPKTSGARIHVCLREELFWGLPRRALPFLHAPTPRQPTVSLSLKRGWLSTT